jgi:hypothetical protein
MAECFMVRTLAGLSATDEQSQAILRRIKFGEMVKVDVVRPRNIKAHRRYFALVNLIYQTAGDFRSPEVVHNTLKALAGRATPVTLKGSGEVVLIPESISFSAMDEDEFQDFWNRVIKAVCEDILPTVTAPEIEMELLRMIGAAG